MASESEEFRQLGNVLYKQGKLQEGQPRKAEKYVPGPIDCAFRYNLPDRD